MPPKNVSLARNAFRLTQLAALMAAMYCPAAHAADFTISSGPPETAQQTLSDNETGVIEAGGTLNYAGVGGAWNNLVPAINASGVNNIVTNNGEITTTGERAYGIYSTGDDATITNHGTILTEGERAQGIRSTGDDATITSSGTITTSEDYAEGISSSGANATITHSGTITTTGFGTAGILSTGANATITHIGTIATEWANERGIWSKGDTATITNNGTISTTGDDSHGILSSGANATITHSGTITTTGQEAHGIYLNGGPGIDTTLNISGSIEASGAISYAIVGEGGKETLNLYSGARIDGDIDLGDGDDTLNLYSGAVIDGTVDLGAGANETNIISNGAGASSTISFPSITSTGGTNTINQTGEGLAFLDSGSNTLHFVDTTNLTADQTMLGNVTSGISGAVNQQLNKTPAMPKPVKVASARLTPGMLPSETGPIGWGNIFGKHEKRGSNGAALGYTDNTIGMVGGYEQSYNDYRVGLYGGVSHSNADTDTASIKNNNDSLFVGVYGQHQLKDNWYLNGSLSVGYVSYNSERQVATGSGTETAQSDYHGLYVSPSVSIMRKIDRGAGFSWRPSAELNYAYGRLSSYDESGTTSSNLSVSSRNVSALNTRLQIAAHQELIDRKGQVEFRGGLTHTNYGSDNVHIALQGTTQNTNYDISGTDSVTGVYVGANTRIHWKKNLNFVGDLEFTRANHDGYTLMGYVGLECLF